MTGTVLEAKVVDDQVVYQIFVDQQTKLFVPASRVTPLATAPEFSVIERDEFLRRLLLFKLRHPLSDVLYSFRASRTQFEVYQFRPVFKFLASDRRSLLIADEVGLGKTIEASLIYLELKARGDLPRVLIVCPSALREKWRSELKFRFDEEFAVLDRKGLDLFLKNYQGTGGLQRLKAIASIELVRDQSFQQAFVENGVTLDLFIIDEAHHAKNAATETHRAARLFADRSENVLLLTATPLQTDKSDLFNLLQMVDSATFSDPMTFGFQLDPNRFVNEAIRALGSSPVDVQRARAMVDVLRSYPETRENPMLDVVARGLASDPPLSPDLIAALRRDLLELNTLSFVFTRTRKRDVQNSAQRTSMTLRVSLFPEEREFYEEMVAQVRQQVQAKRLPAFLVAGRERQAASCLIATRQYLGETYRTKSSDLQHEDGGTDLDGTGAQTVAQAELAQIESLIAQSARIGDRDSKADTLLAHLPDLIASAARGKVLLFSFFRRTITYLNSRLVAAGYQTFVIHGGVNPQTRQSLMAQFSASEKPAILISSEVGAEGLDFQFADTLINYDLPWNPMRVEQRIGRIDRYGQESPKIRVVSLVLDDTIETRILERLYARIRIFEESIGDLEPIVGPEIHRLTEEVLSRNLTPEEEEKLAQEMSVRLATLRQMQDDFEKQSAELMSPDSLFLADVTAAVDAGRVVSSEEVAVTLRAWIRARFPGSDFEASDEGTWHLRADARLAAHYTSYLAQLAEKSDRATQLLQAMNGKNGVPCTFDNRLAQQRPALHFLHVRHPLVRAAIDYFTAEDAAAGALADVRITRIEADAPVDLAGRYTFFINVVRVDAISPQMRFIAVVFDQDGNARPDVAERLLGWVQTGSRPADEVVDSRLMREHYEKQHEVMVNERDRIETLAEERNAALLEARLANVRRSFAAKIAKRREWLAEAGDIRIRRMREAEISNLTVQLQDRLAEIERARSVRVTYELVTGGVATLVGVLPATERAAGAVVEEKLEAKPRKGRTPAPRKNGQPSKGEQAREALQTGARKATAKKAAAPTERVPDLGAARGPLQPTITPAKAPTTPRSVPPRRDEVAEKRAQETAKSDAKPGVVRRLLGWIRRP